MSVRESSCFCAIARVVPWFREDVRCRRRWFQSFRRSRKSVPVALVRLMLVPRDGRILFRRFTFLFLVYDIIAFYLIVFRIRRCPSPLPSPPNRIHYFVDYYDFLWRFSWISFHFIRVAHLAVFAHTTTGHLMPTSHASYTGERVRTG